MDLISIILLLFGMMAHVKDITAGAIYYVAAGLFGIADAIESHKS